MSLNIYMQRMETGQSGVTDVVITAKTGFAPWSKGGVTAELSLVVRGTNGLITGVVELKEHQQGTISKPKTTPPIPDGGYMSVQPGRTGTEWF